MDKLTYLEEELKKYQEKLKHMSHEYAATKSGSAYGVEYYEIQCKVYLDMISNIKSEIWQLKQRKD